MRTMLRAIGCAAILGASFIVGQASAPERAESASSNRAVLKQLQKIKADISKARAEHSAMSREVGQLYPNGDFSGNTPATGLRGAVVGLQREVKKNHDLLVDVCQAVKTGSLCF
jgi:hypothetical protein